MKPKKKRASPEAIRRKRQRERALNKQALADFGNALRAVLGLDPLYVDLGQSEHRRTAQ